MIKKKVCLLGAFAVGKTSLARRFVEGIFSEDYITTVGVKIDKKQIEIDGKAVSLILWDIAGEDEDHKIRSSYLRGMAGYFLVVDRTRRSTLEKALSIWARVEETIGKIPFVVIFSKSDLKDDWDVEEADIEGFEAIGWPVIRSSAKTGHGIEEAFRILATKMLEHK